MKERTLTHVYLATLLATLLVMALTIIDMLLIGGAWFLMLLLAYGVLVAVVLGAGLVGATEHERTRVVARVVTVDRGR